MGKRKSNSRSTGKPATKQHKSRFWRRFTFWVGVASIVSAVVAVLGFFLWPAGTHIDKRVVSHEQKGGVTAGTYNNNAVTNNTVTSNGQSGGITAQNVTVNNYLSLDERQALNQKLLAKYPRGYAVFGVVDGKPTRTIEGLSFEKDFEIVWTGSEIAKFEPNYIDFWPPQIIYKPTGNAALGSFNLRLLRKVGFITPYRLLPSWTNVFLEVLDDKGSFAVLVLGFKE